MGNDTEEAVCTSRLNSHPKVHSSMCRDLSMMLDKVSDVLPSIEAAQPGCKAGIEELCNLYNVVDKGKLIIQNCMECSSLYLAITCEATSMRCERIRIALRRSLFLIQNMVKPLLANQVADVHNDIGVVKFIVDPAEEKAGKAILEMMRQSEATQELELQTFLLAASKLNLTSPKAILTERRAIKKLLEKISGTDPKKEAILKYFLYLIRKYGKNINLENGPNKLNQNVNAANGSLNTGLDVTGISTQECFSPTDSGNGRYEDQNSLSGAAIPPPELCCPMSLTLMHDPVIIETGQTYERENIERWFNEGNDTCPRTQLKLQNLTITPNTCMKAVICNWRNDQIYLPEKFQGYSVSSLNNVSAPLITGKNRDYTVDYNSSSFGLSGASYTSSPMREAEQSKASFDLFYSNANYQLYFSFGNFDKTMFLGFFHGLSVLPVELQTKAVKDLKNVLNGNNQIWHSMVSNGFLGAFHEFLKNKSGRYTVQALKAGIQFFLAFLSSGRTWIPLITEDLASLVASFLDSELRMEVLLILHELFEQPSSRNSSAIALAVAPSVFGALDMGDTKCLELALKILCKISSDNDIKSYLVSAGVISKLSPLLVVEGRFTECCLNILRKMIEVKEALELIIRTGQCLSSISDHLDTGSGSEREHAAVILFAVCSCSVEYCSLVMEEGIIPALVDLSVAGTRNAKDCSNKLLRLPRDFKRRDQFSSSCSRDVATNHDANNAPNGSICKQPMSKSARYISRKINIFSKPRSVTLV